jgi:hypothetical protein
MCCPETVTVNLKAVNWLKEKYPELCIKAGLCERIGGRLYTKTLYTTPPQRTWVGTLSLEQLLHTAANWGANYPKGEEFSDALSKKVQQWVEFYSGETYMNPPQQRTWVGMTDEDLAVCGDEDDVMLARYWERVCKEKNHGIKE